jgi:hypothetical protein
VVAEINHRVALRQSGAKIVPDVDFGGYGQSRESGGATDERLAHASAGTVDEEGKGIAHLHGRKWFWEAVR